MTTICRGWQSQRGCHNVHREGGCPYLHIGEGRVAPKNLCRAWQSPAGCPYVDGSCPRLHEGEGNVARHATPCHDFVAGTCTRIKCPFLHEGSDRNKSSKQIDPCSSLSATAAATTATTTTTTQNKIIERGVIGPLADAMKREEGGGKPFRGRRGGRKKVDCKSSNKELATSSKQAPERDSNIDLLGDFDDDDDDDESRSSVSPSLQSDIRATSPKKDDAKPGGRRGKRGGRRVQERAARKSDGNTSDDRRRQRHNEEDEDAINFFFAPKQRQQQIISFFGVTPISFPPPLLIVNGAPLLHSGQLNLLMKLPPPCRFVSG